jgi:hypothetical protein
MRLARVQEPRDGGTRPSWASSRAADSAHRDGRSRLFGGFSQAIDHRLWLRVVAALSR